MVEDVGEGKKSGGLNLPVPGALGLLDKVEIFLQILNGGCPHIHGEGHKDLSGSLSNQTLFLDKLEEDEVIGVGSSDGNGIKEDLPGGLLFL